MNNEGPRPIIPPKLQVAVETLVEAKRATGLTDEQIAKEHMPLLAASVATRADLPLDTPKQRGEADRDVGNAIGTFMMGKLPPKK